MGTRPPQHEKAAQVMMLANMLSVEAQIHAEINRDRTRAAKASKPTRTKEQKAKTKQQKASRRKNR